jgi:hypothetical protein
LKSLTCIYLQTYTFETDSHVEAKRADELNAAMMRLMAAPQLDPSSVKFALSATQEDQNPAPVAPQPKTQKKGKGKARA